MVILIMTFSIRRINQEVHQDPTNLGGVSGVSISTPTYLA